MRAKRVRGNIVDSLSHLHLESSHRTPCPEKSLGLTWPTEAHLQFRSSIPCTVPFPFLPFLPLCSEALFLWGLLEEYRGLLTKNSFPPIKRRGVLEVLLTCNPPLQRTTRELECSPRLFTLFHLCTWSFVGGACKLSSCLMNHGSSPGDEFENKNPFAMS